MMLPDGTIENIEDIGSSIYAKYVYHLRFDKRTGKISCECTGFKFRGDGKPCHHMLEFIDVLKKMGEYNEIGQLSFSRDKIESLHKIPEDVGKK